MILSTKKIAELLDEHPMGSDPLIIAPKPNTLELSKKGTASIDLRLGCWFGVLRHARAPVFDIREKVSADRSFAIRLRGMLTEHVQALDAQEINSDKIDESIQALFDLAKLNEKPIPSKIETSLIKMHYVPFGERFILHPRNFVLGNTLEWLRLPKNVAGYVTSRSSWGRRGLIIATATGVHPHFTGCLTLELFNSGEVPIALYPSMAVCQFFMHSVDNPSDSVTGGSLAGRRKPSISDIQLDDIERILMKIE